MSAKTLVVRRGLNSSFYLFLTGFAQEHGLQLIIDRRVSDRRRTSGSCDLDRRHAERRRPVPVVDPDSEIVSAVEK
jgi:hypothetical protein